MWDSCTVQFTVVVLWRDLRYLLARQGLSHAVPDPGPYLIAIGQLCMTNLGPFATGKWKVIITSYNPIPTQYSVSRLIPTHYNSEFTFVLGDS